MTPQTPNTGATYAVTQAPPKRVPAKNLLYWTQEEIEKGEQYQRKSYDWDFSKERAHTETVFGQRFNFMLVMYSLFIAAAGAARSPKISPTVLAVGSILVSLVGLTTYRAYLRLHINIVILHRLHWHPFEFIDEEITKRPRFKRLWSINWILGIVIPIFCALTLAIGAVLLYTNPHLLTPPK